MKRNQSLLNDLMFIVENMDVKRGTIFLDWIQQQNQYLVWETNFDPKRLKRYKRGDIVLAHFGFNVGAEFGGLHYAVVVKNDSKSNPMLNVIPLSSLKEGQTPDDLHPETVYLGNISGLNDKKSFAKMNQMRPISKLRIFKPKKANHQAFKLTDDQMDLIDEKIVKMFTKIKITQQNTEKSEVSP
ncbi:type II toxin-antitoxin system PemK/MazF family toxin [Klebsiella pneumoniae]|nr:type II toxin-antitoxin system PemK/MazF family toxin [Klebsiella pneumoniae]